MRILVTGASGHFGGAAARTLMERMPARDLILMTRKPDNLAEFVKRGCTIRYGDFDDPIALEAACEGADKMLLISGLKVGQRAKQHANAIEAARNAGIGHIVYTSHIGATAKNTALIAKDHYGTEETLKSAGVPWTAMRNGTYMDSVVDAAVLAALKSGRWVTASGAGKTSFVDRDDCVACAVAVLASHGTRHENRAYNITGSELWSFADAARLITEVAGMSIEMVPVDDSGLYAHFDAIGIPREPLKEFNIDGYKWCSADMVSYERAMRDGHFAVVSEDIKMLTGREPMSFRDFVMARAARLKAAVIGT